MWPRLVLISLSRDSDLEIEPAGQEASLGQNTDHRVEALRVVGHNSQHLGAAHPLAVVQETNIGMGGVRVQLHVNYWNQKLGLSDQSWSKRRTVMKALPA